VQSGGITKKAEEAAGGELNVINQERCNRNKAIRRGGRIW